MPINNMTRRLFIMTTTAATATAARAARAAAPGAGTAPDNEFIRVAPDGFSFESAETGQPFVPFGANFVLTAKRHLNMFGPHYDAELYGRVLDAGQALGINVLKVFLPIASVLPDPQAPGEARVADGYLDHLDAFLAMCRKRSIRAVVTLSEWRGSSLEWWRDGGQYFGRRPWQTTPGIDSIAVIQRFWQVLCARLRDNPTVFAYTPCVEWTCPGRNFVSWKEYTGYIPGEIALWHWRRWLIGKYGDLDALNTAWDAAYAPLEDVPLPSYDYDREAGHYLDPHVRILDYQNFREWTTLRYFRPQIATIRSADPNHMVTISNHMRSWNLGEGDARHFLGYTPAEEADLVDYFTLHANYDVKDLADGRGVEEVVHEVEILSRFTRAQHDKPVILEEFNFATETPEQTAANQAAIVRGTVGALSGWMTWYLQYPDGARTADSAHRSAWIDDQCNPTPWGETARALAAELRSAGLSRTPAARTVALDRATDLVPCEDTPLLRSYTEYDACQQPSDFTIPHEVDLDILLHGDRALLCAPVVSASLRPYRHSVAMEGGRAWWERDLDDLKAIGFDTVWISHVMPTFSVPRDEDQLAVLLDLCQERGMRAIVGMGCRPGWYDRLDAADEIAYCRGNIEKLAERHGAHPAFFAWYVPHEIYMCWDGMADYVAELYPAVVSAAKEAAPGKPVTLSPFFLLDKDQIFGSYRYAEPEEYQAYWTGLIKRSGFDIIMLQDSGEHFSYVTNAQRRPFFAAMQAACAAGGARLWGNVEVAEYVFPSIDEFLERYGRVHHAKVKELPWRAVPIPRLEGKLRLAAAYCENIVSWGYYQFGRPHLSDAAAAWYKAYRDYAQRIRANDEEERA